MPLAILAAAAIAVAPTHALPGPRTALLAAPDACPNAWRTTPVSQGLARLSKLGDLPKAALMLPVLRLVDGCPAPTIVRDQVEGDGRFAKSPRD